jgi:hypothetical protein
MALSALLLVIALPTACASVTGATPALSRTLVVVP